MRKGDETFEDAARARVAGEIDDNEFLRRTMRTWKVVTARLWRRWRRKLPPDIGRDDVLQCLLLLAVKYVQQCAPERLTESGSYGGYIVWCATRRAQRQIHKWRGAKLSGNESKNLGRVERCFSSLARRDDDRRDDFESRCAGESVDPVERIEGARAFRAHLGGVGTVREALVLIALRRAEGSIPEAAEQLWLSYPARVELGLRDEDHAYRLVRAAVTELTEAVGEFEVRPVYPPRDLFDPPPAPPQPLWERALEGRGQESRASVAA